MPSISKGMADSIRIRPIERGELGAMLRIFSEAIPHTQLVRSIYLAPCVEAFLARLLEHGDLHRHEQLWAVELEGQGMVAAAHTRLIGPIHHLNNYAVLPAFQNRGLGGKMMAYWDSLARSQRARRLSLDVAVENEGARRHYARAGFVDETRSHEYLLRGPVDLPEAIGVRLEDWPLAQASFQAYGFGRFALALERERHPVDLRVGEFRLGSVDSRLLATLQRMDPARSIVVRTTGSLEPPAWVYTGTIVRMAKDLAG